MDVVRRDLGTTVAEAELATHRGQPVAQCIHLMRDELSC